MARGRRAAVRGACRQRNRLPPAPPSPRTTSSGRPWSTTSPLTCAWPGRRCAHMPFFAFAARAGGRAPPCIPVVQPPACRPALPCRLSCPYRPPARPAPPTAALWPGAPHHPRAERGGGGGPRQRQPPGAAGGRGWQAARRDRPPRLFGLLGEELATSGPARLSVRGAGAGRCWPAHIQPFLSSKKQ